MNRLLLNVWCFFRSTFMVNFALSLGAMLFHGFSSFKVVFLSFGFVASIAIYEVRYKSTYVFYANNGISKYSLWLYAYMFCWLLIIMFILFGTLI